MFQGVSVSRHDTTNEWQQPNRTERKASHARMAVSDDAEPGECRSVNRITAWTRPMHFEAHRIQTTIVGSKAAPALIFSGENFNVESNLNISAAPPPHGSRESHQQESQRKPLVSTYTATTDSSCASLSNPMTAESQDEIRRLQPPRGPACHDAPWICFMAILEVLPELLLVSMTA